MSALVDFLLARIGEDEEAITAELHRRDVILTGPFRPQRLLAECEAKRRIVGIAQAFESAIGAQSNERTIGSLNGLRMAVKELALPYADHPDFQPEWSA